jgi:hypothetical protein
VTELSSTSDRSVAETMDRMHLRYGLNAGRYTRDLACGPLRERLLTSIREAGTALVRVSVNPSIASMKRWHECEAMLDSIRQAGAAPALGVSSPEAWTDSAAVRKFANDCGNLAARCVDRWGREEVSTWFWSVGDKPNSPWMDPVYAGPLQYFAGCRSGLSFEGYRDVYERTAFALKQQIGSSTEHPRIGGPCIDGFQSFWFDWMWRFAEEVDSGLIGFAAWNLFGEWREPGSWSAPVDPSLFERLLLSRTSEYWTRAEAVQLLLQGRGILNVCSELGPHFHPDPLISGEFNQGAFGAVYYASSLIELLRGGADAEFLWADCWADGFHGTSHTYEAKKLIARNVRFGDCISFPLEYDPAPDLDAVLACTPDHRAAVLVHRCRGVCKIELDRWPELSGFSRVSFGGGGSTLLDRQLVFDGYGVALLHDKEAV